MPMSCYALNALQVAAFGPLAAKSILFLGHIHRVSITHCQAGQLAHGHEGKPSVPREQAELRGSQATRVWQATVVPGVTGTMPLRTGGY